MSALEGLLQRTGVESSLIGDLLEQRHAGRSASWLWRQAVAAILVNTARITWAHRVLAVRALAVGGATVWLLRHALLLPERAITRLFGVSVGNYLLQHGHDSLRWVFLHYQLYDLPVVAGSCAICAAAATMVSVTHRSWRGPMVLLFAGVTELWWLIALADHFRGALLMPKANLYPYMETLSFVLKVPSMLVAGLASTARQRRSGASG